MRAGDLRDRVTIRKSTEVSDGHDGFTETWSDVRSRVPAQVMPLQGRDLQSAQQIDPRISHDVTFRYWRTFGTDVRGGRVQLTYHAGPGDRTFDVVGAPIDLDEAHVSVLLHCREAA